MSRTRARRALPALVCSNVPLCRAGEAADAAVEAEAGEPGEEAGREEAGEAGWEYLQAGGSKPK